jgi:hypothetical protein
VEAARHLLIMLGNYKNVTTKAYDNEIALATAILNHLTSDCLEYVNILEFTGWTTEILSALQDFSALIARRDAHNATKPESNIKEIRRKMDVIYHRMTTKINSAATLGTTPSVLTLINKINPEIERLNAQYGHARHDIASCEPAPIAQQAYTGEAITPLPEVFYNSEKTGTVKLVLGKDYNLSYKNNINVGNAECIITGKGKFKNKKTVTFIIARI